MFNMYEGINFILKSKKMPDRWRVTLMWSEMILENWDFITIEQARQFMESIKLVKEMPYPKHDIDGE